MVLLRIEEEDDGLNKFSNKKRVNNIRLRVR